MGDHWNGVQGLGIKGFILSVMVPILPASLVSPRTSFLILFASFTIPSISSSVSVGTPIRKYSFAFSIPLEIAISTDFRISSSDIPLFITFLRRSVPASGAKVMVLCPLSFRASTSSSVVESIRREETETFFPFAIRGAHRELING